MAVGYVISVVGERPGLVQNNPKGMMDGECGTGGKQTYTPEKDAAKAAYRMESSNGKPGELYIPSDWFRAAILKTASNIYSCKLGGKKQYIKSWLAGTCEFLPEQIGLGISKYEIYSCTAIINNARIIKSRPRIYPWSCTFYLRFSDSDPFYADFAAAIENIIPDCIRMTGIKQGIGDNRPGSPKKAGPHGRFNLQACEFVHDIDAAMNKVAPKSRKGAVTTSA